MIRRPPRSTQSRSSAASDVYKRQDLGQAPAEHIAAEVKQYEPRDSEENPEGQRDPSGCIGSDEHPPRRQRDFGAGTKVYRSHSVSSSELVAAFIGTLDRILS